MYLVRVIYLLPLPLHILKFWKKRDQGYQKYYKVSWGNFDIVSKKNLGISKERKGKM